MRGARRALEAMRLAVDSACGASSSASSSARAGCGWRSSAPAPARSCLGAAARAASIDVTRRAGTLLVRHAASRASAAAAAAAAAAPPRASHPPPDLAAGAPHPALAAAAARVSGWVVFSDLHVSEETCDTCIQVLAEVHAAAVRRGAGILFLGDFWHAKEALPVGPLNRVLAEVRAWTQPALMLVGNHDQATAAGDVHGLSPLAAVNDRVHVFTHPTLFAGALWLPYRSDPGALAAAVAAAGPGLAAVFAHADVRGARMNNHRTSEHGAEAAIFPPGVPVISGHFHLPHALPGTGITYVGSPYQARARTQAWHAPLTARPPLACCCRSLGLSPPMPPPLRAKPNP